MEKPQQAKYANKVCEYVFADGSHEIRQEGSLTWRLNNPGALRPPLDPHSGQPAPKKTKGYIGFATVSNNAGKGGQFFIFPDYETGREAVRGNLQRLHSQKCIPEMVKAYAPSNENDPKKYADDLVAWTGIPRDRKLCDMSKPEIEKLIDAIIRKEGWKEGQRKVINTTSVSFTDGTCPQQGVELKVCMNGTENSYLSNQFGKVPPIPHIGNGVIQILFKTVFGEWKKILDINPGDPSKNLLVTIKDRIFSASTDVHARPAEAPKQPQPFKYVVQPGDTLSKIAKKFNTTAAKIQQDNNIKDAAKIYPAEAIWIFGMPLEMKASTPRSALADDLSNNTNQSANNNEEANTARSRGERGAPLALLPVEGDKPGWMKFALEEAYKWRNKNETEIGQTINYHKEIGLKDHPSLSGDYNAWCASFVNYCLKKAGYSISSRPAAAISFLEDKKNFIKIDKPIYGAIAIFSRHGGNHACFIYSKGKKDGSIVEIGGNQHDAINFVERSGVKGLVGLYVPITYKEQAAKDATSILPSYSAKELNAKLGIDPTTSVRKES